MKAEAKELKYKVGAHIKGLRVTQQLTLQALANLSGLSKSHVWEIEKGNTMPTISTAMAISSALGVSLDCICGQFTILPDLHPDAIRIAQEIDAIIRGAWRNKESGE